MRWCRPPPRTAKTAANPALRFGAVFVPMGERPGFWTPKTTGAGFEFSPILKPLESFRDSLLVVSNLDRPSGGTHAVSTATWLTGSSPKRTEAEDFLAGTSLDQMIAGQIGRDTVLPSLEMATEDQAGYIGACDVGYSCAYMSTIAWKGADDAAADADQPARGLRADVRPARLAPPIVSRACAAIRAFWIR